MVLSPANFSLTVPPLPLSEVTAGLRNQSCKRSSNLSESPVAKRQLKLDGGGGGKLIENDSKCLEGGNF